RSALPVLRKAVALQPNDARIQGWLAQTQAALEGGPPPDVAGMDLLANALEHPSAPPREEQTQPLLRTNGQAPENGAALEGPPILSPVSEAPEANSEERTEFVSPAQMRGLLKEAEAAKAGHTPPPPPEETTLTGGLLDELPSPDQVLSQPSGEPGSLPPPGEG